MSLSHRNQSTDSFCKSIDWFLCQRDIDRWRVKTGATFRCSENYLNTPIRGGSSTAATSKMECFVIIVTIITKRFILDVAAVLDPPLKINGLRQMNKLR